MAGTTLAREGAITTARTRDTDPTGKSISIFIDTAGDEVPRRLKNHVRAKTDFASSFNPIPPVQSRHEKYSAFVFSEIDVPSPCPVLERGALRDRHERWARDAVDVAARGADCAKTTCDATDGQAVWSWHPDADAKLAMMLRIARATVAKKPGAPGRARSKP
jgi:hypothetical protein